MHAVFGARTTRAWLLLGWLSLLVVVPGAGAAPVLVSDDRRISGFADTWIRVEGGTPTDEMIDTRDVGPSSPFSPLDGSVSATAGSPSSTSPAARGAALATQRSQVAPTLFTASGDASFELQTATATAYGTVIGVSMFQIVFELATAHAFTLEGIVDAIDPGSFASITLDGLSSPSGPPLFTVLALVSTAGTEIEKDGILAAGLYRLSAEARAQAANDRPGVLGGEAGFGLHFATREASAAVPEPTSIVLLGLGLAVAATRLASRAGRRVSSPPRTPAARSAP